jgi:hypothetical protein
MPAQVIMSVSSSTAINVIEDLTPLRQGKSFAGWCEIYYDDAVSIYLYKMEAIIHKS